MYTQRFFIILTGLLLSFGILMISLENYSLAGPVLIALFIVLSLWVRPYPNLRNIAFSMMILSAVTAAMFYPEFFRTIGGFELSRLIVPLLMIIMFGMGTEMSIQDFKRIIQMPKGVILGIICQFTIMPFVGLGLMYIFRLPAEIAAGFILVGCSPSGLASNVMAYIAKANLALSLTLTAVATLLAPVMTPFLMETLANRYVPIDFLAMLWSIVRIVIIPVIAGLTFNHFFKGKFQWLDKAMPMVSMIGIGIIIAIITSAGRDSLLTIGMALIIAVMIHNGLGYFLGYLVARGLGMDRQSCRTIALEVGMQNAGLASGIAMEMGKLATMGLAPAVFGPWMNISGSMLATWWRGRSAEDAISTST